MTTAVTLKGIKRRWIKATASTSEQQLLKKNADKKTFPATHIGTYTTFKIWHTKLKLDRTEMTVIGWIFSFTLKEKENNNNNNNMGDTVVGNITSYDFLLLSTRH